MSLLHILWTPRIARPWWQTDARFPDVEGKRVWTDCCGCKVIADHTEARLVCSYEPPYGGLGDYQEPPFPSEPDYPTGAYFEPIVEVRCAEGFGCTVNPRKKAGRSLREMWRYGA